MRYHFTVRHFIGLIFALFLTFISEAAHGQTPLATAPNDPGYKVENLSADLYSGGTILLVKGDIRNTRPMPIRGYAIVHLQSETRDEVGAFEAEVNKNSPVLPGKTGTIELAINIAQFPKAKNVSIEFVSR